MWEHCALSEAAALDPAVGLLEFASIAAGIVAGDAMVKASPVGSIYAGTVHPGKYLVLVSGDTASVETALDAGCDMVLVCNDRPAAVKVLDGLRSHGSAVRGARLARMHGRHAVTRDALLSDTHYRDVVAEITALDVTPELDLGDDTLL